MQHDTGMLAALPPLLTGLFDLGVSAYMVRRMRRTMVFEAFRVAVVIESVTMAAGVGGMLIKGYSITLMLVIIGLAETAVVLSTWGRVEVFFYVIAQPESWTSRHATIVSLRFCAVALVLLLATIPLWIRLS